MLEDGRCSSMEVSKNTNTKINDIHIAVALQDIAICNTPFLDIFFCKPLLSLIRSQTSKDGCSYRQLKRQHVTLGMLSVSNLSFLRVFFHRPQNSQIPRKLRLEIKLPFFYIIEARSG